MTFGESLQHHIAFGKWLTNSGRAFILLEDTDFRSAVYDVTLRAAETGKAYLPCSSAFIDGNSEMAKITFELTTAAIAADLQHAMNFYCGQPFCTGYWDGWTAKNKIPFMGFSGSWVAPWAEEPRRATTFGVLHMPGTHDGDAISKKLASTMDERYNVTPTRVQLSATANKGKAYNERTGLSEMFIGSCTDAGGGVPAAARRLGVGNRHCDLHHLDTVQVCTAAALRRAALFVSHMQRDMTCAFLTLTGLGFWYRSEGQHALVGPEDGKGPDRQVAQARCHDEGLYAARREVQGGLPAPL
jgi:hypothetical protein